MVLEKSHFECIVIATVCSRNGDEFHNESFVSICIRMRLVLNEDKPYLVTVQYTSSDA